MALEMKLWLIYSTELPIFSNRSIYPKNWRNAFDLIFFLVILQVIFFKINLKLGYCQLWIEESGVPNTTFMTRYKHYKFLVMLFGLANASTKLMNMMNWLFRPILRYPTWCLVHMSLSWPQVYWETSQIGRNLGR